MTFLDTLTGNFNNLLSGNNIFGGSNNNNNNNTSTNPITDVFGSIKGKVDGLKNMAPMILIGAGHLSAVQDDALIAKAKRRTDRLNAYLAMKARSSGDITFLASPVTGGGVAVARFQQLFLLAIAQGKKQPREWPQAVWQLLEAQGQKIVKEGHTLETAEENLAEIKAQAETFALKQWPIMKALQIT